MSENPKRKLTGLDDGPPLPSAQALARAYAAIEASHPPTDTELLNWLESEKYIQFGVGYQGNSFLPCIRFRGMEFSGRSLRDAIRAAMDAMRKLS